MQSKKLAENGANEYGTRPGITSWNFLPQNDPRWNIQIIHFHTQIQKIKSGISTQYQHIFQHLYEYEGIKGSSHLQTRFDFSHSHNASLKKRYCTLLCETGTKYYKRFEGCKTLVGYMDNAKELNK